MKRLNNLATPLLCITFMVWVSCTSGTGSGTPTISISIPSTLSFGSVAVSETSGALTVTLRNTSSSSISLSSTPTIVGPNAADFSIVSTTCTALAPIAPNATCVVLIEFTPATASAKSASLVFAITGASNTATVALSGTGVVSVDNELPGQVTLSSSNNVNAFFVTVRICIPGTSTCQTIPNVELDTGSTGLRLPASVLTLSLATSTDTLGNEMGNCVQFADLSYAFGPVKLADIKLSGETALNVPIQIIHDTSFFATPSSCVVPGGTEITSASAFGANGLLGISVFKEDCGPACVSSAIPGTYYSCTGSSCTAARAPLNKQLQNPVAKFSQDNNGIVVALPAIGATGAQSVNGTLIFGIGTASNNALGSAEVFTTDSAGNISTVYNGNTYTSFIDSGSNGIFFLSPAATSMPECSTFQGFYCPASTTSFTVTNQGQNSNSADVTFSVQNAQTLFNVNPTYSAFNNLAGPFPNIFDFGMPFFFGKRIFFGIEGESVGSTTGPLVAY